MLRQDNDSLDRVCTHLGQEQFERTYAAGLALSPEEALDLAAGKTLPG